MFKTFLRSAGVLALAGLLLAPISTTASALTPPAETPGESFSMTEAFAIIHQILILEKQKASAEKALKTAADRIVKQESLIAAKDKEIKVLEAEVAQANANTKPALEKKLRAARFERIKLEAAFRSLAIQQTTARMQVSIIGDQIETQRTALNTLTNGACSVTKGGFSCVL